MNPQLLSALQAEFAKSPSDLSKIGSDILEMGAYWSVHVRDGVAFERYLRQLTPYISSPATYSPRTPILLGLHLLNLLVTGRISEYRVRLAALTRPALPTIAPVEFVVTLERCLQEGLYHRLLEAKGVVPAPEYVWLLDSLIETVRRELALGIEKAFDSLEVSVAAQMLLFESSHADAVCAFGTCRGWTVKGTRFVLASNTQHKGSETSVLQTSPTVAIGRALCYANALEQIV